MSHEAILEILPAYALDAVTPAEAREVERHLRDCAICRAELAGFRDVAAGLASAVPAVEPPAALRARVLAVAARPASVILFPRRGVFALAAAAVLAVVILAADVITLNREVVALRTRLGAQEQVMAVLAGRQARSVALEGSVPAAVRLVFDPGTGQGALVATGLGDPGPGRVYQVWLISGRTPESAGVFVPAAGRAVILPVAADFRRYTAVAISIEQGPLGARLPTTRPILAGSI